LSQGNILPGAVAYGSIGWEHCAQSLLRRALSDTHRKKIATPRAGTARKETVHCGKHPANDPTPKNGRSNASNGAERKSDPKFRMQLLNLIATLLGTGTAQADEVVVHLVRHHDTRFIDCLRELGVKVAFAEPYGDPRALGCNRIAQLDTPELQEADFVVMLDTDLAFTRNVRKVFAVPGISAKPVDLPNPPLDTLNSLLRESGINCEPAIVKCTFDSAETFSTNCNGGVLVFDRVHFRQISAGWKKWAAWVLRQEAIVGWYVRHAVQISLCLAMLEEGIEVTHLDVGINFATHLDPACYLPEHNIAPVIIHYHWKMDSQGLIERIGLSEVDRAVGTANSIIQDFRSKVPNGSVLEEFRRKYHSEAIV